MKIDFPTAEDLQTRGSVLDSMVSLQWDAMVADLRSRIIRAYEKGQTCVEWTPQNPYQRGLRPRLVKELEELGYSIQNDISKTTIAISWGPEYYSLDQIRAERLPHITREQERLRALEWYVSSPENPMGLSVEDIVETWVDHFLMTNPGWEVSEDGFLFCRPKKS
jgi:hypothetical protein